MDIPAYLRRINHQSSQINRLESPGSIRPSIPLLRALHSAHLFTVPFENFDISLGREISCDESQIVDKIVNQHRGGFCYELNGAFAALLRALGFQVTLLSARVAGTNGSYSAEFDHLALLVDLEEQWLADVGFGDCFVEPLRLEPGAEHAQCGRSYRLQRVDDVFRLDVMAEAQWKTEYAFTLQPRKLSDFAPRCRYHQTSPESHFTRQQICSLATPEGRITLSGKKLIETRGNSRREVLLSGKEELRATLRDRFGLVLPESLQETTESKRSSAVQP
jgi:N-hydroxyarylamine O-acetyltransferase